MAPKPVAFMVMPYGTRATDTHKPGVPKQIDFDDLWNRVYFPLLEQDYTPVRADNETGALIVVEMIQRLAAADLVLADITLPNANVYYEVGVRHAARRKGCVLVGADWAELAFDLQQIRQLRFPLPSTKLTDDEVAAVRAALAADLDRYATGESPVFQAVPDFPNQDAARLDSFREYVREMSMFDASVRAIELGSSDGRGERIAAFLEAHPAQSLRTAGVALTVLEMLRDHGSMQDVLTFVDELPEAIANDETIQEQYFLAQSKAGDSAAAAAALEALIAQVGPSSERYGLLGGRYKALRREAKAEAEKRRFLELAIDAYEAGMREDLNDYYPVSNLPRLYLERDEPDELMASITGVQAMVACQRAIDKGLADEFARPTLLGLAFDRRDIEAATKALGQIRREGIHLWKLDTTLQDLETSFAQMPTEISAEFEVLLAELRELVAAA